MATGGTIPQDRKQYVTFYNTTGIIEKDKNIYFVPRFSKTARAGNFVLSEWRIAFNSVCPPASKYTDIEISSWSPQDRTLRVQGDIDDFRVVTSEGSCLNYLIMRRRVKKTTAFIDSYYAFFITNAKQAGGSSVELTLEPDYFTNVFYLHNNRVLSADDVANDYEPFNDKMKNCYVNRQHYNRVKIGSYESQYNTSWFHSGSFTASVGDTINIKSLAISSETPIDYGRFKILSIGIADDIIGMRLLDLNTQRETVSIPLNTLQLIDITNSQTYIASLESFEKNEQTSKVNLSPDNMKIFLNQEESFKYKYQYRDMKYPVSIYDGVFTDEEKQQIEEASEIEDLALTLRNKVLLSCISYLVVETKSPEVCYIYRDYNRTSDTYVDRDLDMGEMIDLGINRPNPVICYPFINSPDPFKKFNLENKTLFYGKVGNFLGNESLLAGEEIYKGYLIKSVLSRLNHYSIGDYVHSVYVTNDVLCPKSNYNIIYTVDPTSHTNVIKIQMLLKLPKKSYRADGTNTMKIDEKGLFVAGIRANLNEQGVPAWDLIFEAHNGDSPTDGMAFSHVGFLASGYYSRKISLDINKFDISKNDLVSGYFDNILEAEPYKFYSLSTYASYELPFNKNRYYDSLTVDIVYFMSVNGAIKLGYVPQYTVEGKATLYYNESLTFTTSSTLPLVSDSYYSYYNQNKAQMKNQYAVNDYNRGIDLLQHALISGPNAVGMAGSKRGGWGALAEAGNQFMQMANEGIDWAQSNKEIGMNQTAKLADMGNKPDTMKQAGSDIFYDLRTSENFLYINHYSIDERSYISIAKYLERFGYQINLYDNIHAVDRVGWNYVILNNFDFETAKLTLAEEQAIKQIFFNGVTLLHDKSYLTSGHNYETILEGGN